MSIKVGLVPLGCSKNQVDAEIMLSLISREGYEICPDPEQADVVIVNTCGFIEDAKKESIENILTYCDRKATGQVKAVVVTGCLAERYRDDMATDIPEADVILGIGSNGEIVQAIERALKGERVVQSGAKTDLSLEGDRILTNLPFYAYIKVADGCDNRCSYCAIPLIRGNFRSRGIEEVVEECRRLASRGVREFNLVAQDTTRYGVDRYGKAMLPELIDRVCAIDGVHWVRILYCYPERITDELLDAMARQPKVMRYMDMPVQHCNARILKEMNRRGSREQLLALMEKIRAKLPGVVLRTTLIAGFPGETQEEFEELCSFVKEAKFERLGCFSYSVEEDTPAAQMECQLDEEEKRRRAEIIMQEQVDIAFAFSQSCVGKTLEVAVEGYDRLRRMSYGRSYMDAPDIDTRVYFDGKCLTGSFVSVIITGADGYDLTGQLAEKRELADEPSK